MPRPLGRRATLRLVHLVVLGLPLLQGCATGVPPRLVPPPPARVLPLPELVMPAAPFTPVLAVAPGRTHTCALEATGRVVCWGSDSDGQLGPGKRWFASQHAHLAEGAIDIVSGRHQTCVLGPSGKVRCWGGGRERIFDLDTSAVAAWGTSKILLQKDGAVLVSRRAPLGRMEKVVAGPASGLWKVVPLSGAARVSTRPLMFAALLSGGDLLCSTALPDFELACPGTRAEGFQRSYGLGGVEVAVSDDVLCVLQSTGDVHCTGSARVPGVRAAFRRVFFPKKAIKLTGGARHTCALLEDQTVWCWASDGPPSGLFGPFNARTSPERIAGLQAVRSVVAGDEHTCAIEDSGALFCWGSNEDGQVALDGPRGGVSRPRWVDLSQP